MIQHIAMLDVIFGPTLVNGPCRAGRTTAGFGTDRPAQGRHLL